MGKTHRWILYGTLPWLAMIAVAFLIGRPAGAATTAPPASAPAEADPLVATPSFLTSTLTGANEVPNPGDPDGSGTIQISLNRLSGQVCYDLTVNGIVTPTGAHIHTGAAGTAGGVVVDLGLPPLGTSTNTCVGGSPDVIAAILQNPAAYYVNIHTSEFPAGAIRGQLGLPSIQIQVTALLTGTAEVPNPGDPDGTGVAIISIDPFQRAVCYDLSVSNIATPTAAHIHFGPPGVSGGVSVTLGTPVTGTVTGCAGNVPAATVQALVDDPQGFYVNVHNGEFPGGAVRGQLGAGYTAAASLTGGAEVPGPGDLDGTGTAILTLNPTQGIVCYDLRVRDILTPTAAHIHTGTVGVAGGVVIPLLTPTGGGIAACSSGLASRVISDIVLNPAGYYVNVHNSEFPAGAIRGQIGSAVRHNSLLLGRNEVPNPGDPDGQGVAAIVVNQTQRSVCYDLQVIGIMTPTAAHIHTGTVGVAGSVAVGLGTPTSGAANGCIDNVSDQLILNLIRNPGGYYVNVHNAEFPGGALRGQLDDIGVAVNRFAVLTGTAEVPGPGDADGTGFADLALNVTGASLCYSLSVSNIATPTAAHIHTGTVGVAGAVVIPLQAPGSGEGSVSTCQIGVNPVVLAGIVDQPQNYYVNVHNAEFPAGAVRGQIVVTATAPATATPTPTASSGTVTATQTATGTPGTPTVTATPGTPATATPTVIVTGTPATATANPAVGTPTITATVRVFLPLITKSAGGW